MITSNKLLLQYIEKINRLGFAVYFDTSRSVFVATRMSLFDPVERLYDTRIPTLYMRIKKRLSDVHSSDDGKEHEQCSEV